MDEENLGCSCSSVHTASHCYAQVFFHFYWSQLVVLFRDCPFFLRKISMPKQLSKSCPEQFKYWISPLVRVCFKCNLNIYKGKFLSELCRTVEKNKARSFPRFLVSFLPHNPNSPQTLQEKKFQFYRLSLELHFSVTPLTLKCLGLVCSHFIVSFFGHCRTKFVLSTLIARHHIEWSVNLF